MANDDAKARRLGLLQDNTDPFTLRMMLSAPRAPVRYSGIRYKPLQVSHMGAYGDAEEIDMTTVSKIGTMVVAASILLNKRL